MLWDNHMHTNFSGDSDARPIDMIKAAKLKGLRGITFTDHLDLDYPKEFGFFDLDLENYYPTQHALALAESNDNFTILTGLEVGIQPHIIDKCKEAVNAQPYDFIIGSTHLVDKWDPYFESFWERASEDALLKRYYECILENINVFTDFDTLGHLDYAFRYAPSESAKHNTHEPYFEIIDAILNRIIKLDKALEVNTAAFRKGMGAPNPAPSIIKRYHELGGKLITLGADAHTPSDIAADFDRLPDLLKECGFNEFVVYKNRKPQSYPIG
ncbi:MAG: histidinol-phosphatase HisJ family protein [Pseudobutyrivibrio ruminis]|nr:histidinol-phosphatase HisJ family protein [Pseudobutyrivibrio ruminis]